ncbi:hypothetical protein POJ06DRAFT_252690 [Lipomyces tetrasporus]|uniref:Uncharacterized protein n=1 Tax=Lipomyces tetrasporus TaxID=54092 RepID=A0AAD7QS40_9ASCO|nr:uncharacterized protein POJ06DRAFT_252690 [Lipomyces tetrasporus]KAJ8100430.1 hypothetical protein POJ06DRAFT_252690 [Lipomyces tetrasporus]
MSSNKRVPYGGAIGMRSSSSMDFHSRNSSSAAAAAAAAVLPRSSSAVSLSSAAAAAALKRANSQNSTHAVMVVSKRAEQKASQGLERRSSMSERVLRSQSVGPERRRLRHSNGGTVPLTTMRTNLSTSTSSLPRTLRSSGGRQPSSSGYASSVRSYESDLNSISEDRTLDTSSILSSPKLVASTNIPPPITEEILTPPVKHEPPPRTFSPSKSAMKDTSRPSSVKSGQSDAEEMNNSSKKKHVRISISGVTSTSPPAMPSFTTARGAIKVADDVGNNTNEKLKEKSARSPSDVANGVDQKKAIEPASATPFIAAAQGISGKAIATVELDEEMDSNSEGSVYEDASDIMDIGRDEFPNLLAVVSSVTEEDRQVNGVLQRNEIVDKLQTELQSARNKAQSRTQAGSTPARKPVGSTSSRPPARMRTPPSAEAESREKSQNPTLQHPIPRTAKPLNGILKTPSPDLSRKAGSDRQSSTRGKHQSLPNSYSGRSFLSLRSASPPPPLPSFDSTADLKPTRTGMVDSSSDSGRKIIGGSQVTSGTSAMKQSLRDAVPTEDLSMRQRPETARSKPVSQSPTNHRVLRHNKPSQLATKPASSAIPFEGLHRSGSASSFKREGGYESDSQAFGFKKLSVTASFGRPQSSQDPNGRTDVLDRHSDDESPAYRRSSAFVSLRTAGVSSGTPNTSGISNGFKSRLVDSDSEDELPLAAPNSRRDFPSSHPFAYEPASGVDAGRGIPPYDDATVGVAVSSDAPASAPEPESAAVRATVSRPTIQGKHRKLSQYQQHRLDKQQKKEEKERSRREQEERNYGTNSISTSIGPIANINSVPMPQPRKKKFGGLRKLLGLSH